MNKSLSNPLRGLCLLFVLSLATSTYAQSNKLQPEPYEPGEFPEWAVDLRRAEIITVGSFPLSYLFASFAFDIGRYVDKLGTDPENASDYAPLFFGNTFKKAYTQDQQVGVVLGAIGVSVVIAIVDFILGQDEKAKQRERDERRAAAAALLNQQNQASSSPQPEPSPSP